MPRIAGWITAREGVGWGWAGDCIGGRGHTVLFLSGTTLAKMRVRCGYGERGINTAVRHSEKFFPSESRDTGTCSLCDWNETKRALVVVRR